MKRFIIRLAWLIGLLSLGLSIYIHIRGKDFPPQDYPELVVLREEVPDEENGFSLLIAAAEQSTLEVHKDLLKAYLKDQIRESEFVELMEENTVAVGFLKKGVGRETVQSPELFAVSDVAPYVQDWLRFSDLLEASSLYLRNQGRLDEATGKTVLLLNFSDRIYTNPEAMIQYLVGISCLKAGMGEARGLARNPDILFSDLENLKQTITKLSPLRPEMLTTLKQEYKFTDKIIRDLEEGKVSLDDSREEEFAAPSKYMFQPNQTRATVATYFLGWLEEGQKNYIEMNLQRFVYKNPPRGKFRRLFRPNPIGELVLGLMLPAMDGFLRKNFQTEASLQATQLLLALQQYERVHESFPELLIDLVPEFLNELPKDPFDGKPFRYDAEQKIIYSVGENGTDEGGSHVLLSGQESDRPGLKRWNAEDAVFFLE